MELLRTIQVSYTKFYKISLFLDTTIFGYEPHKARMSSTGWCGSKDAFIFLSVDLQRIFTLTSLRIAGVASSGHLKGHVTKMQLFYKIQFSQNYDSYPLVLFYFKNNYFFLGIYNFVWKP